MVKPNTRPALTTLQPGSLDQFFDQSLFMNLFGIRHLKLQSTSLAARRGFDATVIFKPECDARRPSFGSFGDQPANFAAVSTLLVDLNANQHPACLLAPRWFHRPEKSLERICASGFGKRIIESRPTPASSCGCVVLSSICLLSFRSSLFLNLVSRLIRLHQIRR